MRGGVGGHVGGPRWVIFGGIPRGRTRDRFRLATVLRGETCALDRCRRSDARMREVRPWIPPRGG